MSTILFNHTGYLGHIILNRPQALNALNLEMIREIDRLLSVCENDTGIHHILFSSSSEKAYCAGGDIREATLSPLENAQVLFAEEYRLNYRIATFTKPIYSFVDGVCMGGGLGISIHTSCCFATERAQFAMPEMAIGLFPDVGTAYQLARAPGFMGEWFALTGTRLGARDANMMGLCHETIHSSAFSSLIQHLQEAKPGMGFPAFDDVDMEDVWGACRKEIDKIFSADHVEGIFERLEACDPSDHYASGHWQSEALKKMRSFSPTALKRGLAHVRQARLDDLKTVLARDYCLACQCLEETDFKEGVRALLIDRDNTPHWQPARLSDVNPSAILADNTAHQLF